MHIIAQRNQLEQIRTIKNLLFAKNADIYRLRYYTNSFHHTVKLRLAQAFAFLFRLDRQWDDRLFKILMDEANQVNVTHINELIIAETVDAYHMIDLIEKVNTFYTYFRFLSDSPSVEINGVVEFYPFCRWKVTKVFNQCSLYYIMFVVKNLIHNTLVNPSNYWRNLFLQSKSWYEPQLKSF